MGVVGGAEAAGVTAAAVKSGLDATGTAGSGEGSGQDCGGSDQDCGAEGSGRIWGTGAGSA